MRASRNEHVNPKELLTFIKSSSHAKRLLNYERVLILLLCTQLLSAEGAAEEWGENAHIKYASQQRDETDHDQDDGTCSIHVDKDAQENENSADNDADDAAIAGGQELKKRFHLISPLWIG
jgi:hypothetical protein